MTLADAIVALATGLVAGTYAGLLGVGGGIVMVPSMALLLAQSQHVAEGTSLVVIIPTAVAGTIAFSRRGLVDFAVARWLALGGVGGAVAGAVLAIQVITDERLLRRIFAVFLLLVVARLALPRRRGAGAAGRGEA